jgi:hypothetical protein
MSLLDDARALVTSLEFEQRVRNKLDSVRLTHESADNTLDRILRLATERICPRCRGYGGGSLCGTCYVCGGLGSLAVAKSQVRYEVEE